MTKTLAATYKAIVSPILNYAAPIWFTQVSSTHLEQTWSILEQGSEDRNWLSSKGLGVPPQSRDWGPPPEVKVKVVLGYIPN